MGEQTQVQKSQSQAQPSSQPDKSDSTSPPQPTLVTDASSIHSNVSHISSNASKIPIRPQKIRKLSSNSSSTVAPSTTPSLTPVNITTSSTTTTTTATSDGKSIQITDSLSSPSPSHVPIPTTITAATTSTVTSTAVTTPTAASTPKSRRRSASHSSRVLPQIIKPLSADGEIDSALCHLRIAHPLLAALIDNHPPPVFESHHSPFLALTKSILYQQLAYKAGTSIYNRFVSLCGGEGAVIPDNVLALSAQQLKQVGVSGRKASYLYDLANKYKSGILSDETVVKMDDKSLFTMLSMVKGIGSWSVHMFMIFSLHRPDVLPMSDLGVRKGVQLLYGLEELPRPSQMEQLCEKWRPYRSVGAWYMWRLVEGKGAQNAGVALQLEGDNAGVQPLEEIGPQQNAQQQHQLQLLEPINGMGNLGACIWGQ